MTTIYKISNPLNGTINYVCDSQATIDIGQLDQSGNIQGAFSVGTSDDANIILSTIQSDVLSSHSDRFVVNEEITLGDVTKWLVVDLDTEASNTDKQYHVFIPMTGQYNPATGLSAAQSFLEQTKQDYLTFCKLDSYITLTEWPTPPTK